MAAPASADLVAGLEYATGLVFDCGQRLERHAQQPTNYRVHLAGVVAIRGSLSLVGGLHDGCLLVSQNERGLQLIHLVQGDVGAYMVEVNLALHTPINLDRARGGYEDRARHLG